MLDQTKLLLNHPVGDDVHDSISPGQSPTNLVLGRLDDLVFELDDLRSILCVQQTTLRNLSLAKVLLLVVIPG